MDDAEIVTLFETCSNTGRWGPDDEIGALNLLTPEVRLRAIGLVRTGQLVEIGRRLVPGPSSVARHPVAHHMLMDAPTSSSAIDLIEVTPHDPSVTHVDVPCHTFWEGKAWNGRRQTDVVTRGGLTFGALDTSPGAIITRGVLLDVAAARGVDWLAADDFVTSEDLDAAEELAMTRVAPGDAVIVNVGRSARERATPSEPLVRAGLRADAMPWLFRRDVAVFAGDCTERFPYPSVRVPFPLHQIGSVAMGLCLLDGVDPDPLVAACRENERNEFLLGFSAPRITGATGFPVNPFCMF